MKSDFGGVVGGLHQAGDRSYRLARLLEVADGVNWTSLLPRPHPPTSVAGSAVMVPRLNLKWGVSTAGHGGGSLGDPRGT